MIKLENYQRREDVEKAIKCGVTIGKIAEDHNVVDGQYFYFGKFIYLRRNGKGEVHSLFEEQDEIVNFYSCSNSAGFRSIIVDKYCPDDGDVDRRLLTESTMIAATERGINNPGSSYLWIGDDWHLSRSQVVKMISCMQEWLNTGRLPELGVGGDKPKES